MKNTLCNLHYCDLFGTFNSLVDGPSPMGAISIRGSPGTIIGSMEYLVVMKNLDGMTKKSCTLI